MKTHVTKGNYVVLKPVLRKDGCWQGRIRDLRQIGKIVYLYLATRETNRRKADQKVENWVRDLEKKDTQGEIFQKTFEEAFELWVSTRRIRDSTRKDYESIKRVCTKAFEEERLVCLIKPSSIERFLKSNKEKGHGYKKGSEKCRGGSTRQKYLTVLRSFFKWAVREKLCQENPTLEIKERAAPKRVGVALKVEHAQTLLNLCKGSQELEVKRNGTTFNQEFPIPGHLWLAVLISLHTGLRQINVLGLKWRHLDLDNQQIRFSAEEMKGNADIILPIHPELLEVLERLSEESGAPPEKNVIGEVTEVKKSFSSAVERAGLKKMRWHDLRHTFATWVSLKAPYAVLQTLLGHRIQDVTGTYIHVSGEELKKAIDGLPRLLVEAQHNNESEKPATAS